MAEIGIKTLLYLNEHNESVRFEGGASGTVLIGAGTTALPQWKTLADAGISATGHTHSYAGSSSAGGAATTATTTADTNNTLYIVGVTSSATTTLKRDTSVSVKGGTITATTFAGTADKVKAALSVGTGLKYETASVTYIGETARTISLNTEAEITWTNTHTFSALPKLNTSGVLIAKDSNTAIAGLQATGAGHILQYKVVNGSGTYVFDHVPSTGVTDDAEYKLVGVVSVGGALKVPNVTGKVVSFNPSTGTLIATHFSGDGSNLTNLASQNLSGSIPSSLLPDLSGNYLPLIGGLMNGPISSRIIESYGRYYGCLQYQWNTSVTTIAITTPFPCDSTGGTVPPSADGEQFFQLHITGIDNASNGKTLDVKVGIAVAVGGAINSSHSGWSSIGTITPSSVKHGTITHKHAVVITLPAVTNGNHMRINVDACFDYWAKRDNNWMDSIPLYTAGNAWGIDNNTTGITLDSGDGLTYYAANPPSTAGNGSTAQYLVGTTAANGALMLANMSGKTISFKPSTGELTATTFNGALTGNVTGNCSGSSGSCTGNAATATSATKATTTEDTSNTLYIVGVTSSATTTLKRDTSVSVKGGTITATTFNGALTGNVTGNCSGSSGSCTGNAATASAWKTGRTISLTGGVTGTSAAWTGSGNLSIVTTLSSHNHSAGDINSGVFGVGRGGTGLSTYAKGDILYCSDDSGTDPVLSKLSIGSANQMLTVDPVNGIPAWDTVPVYFAVCETAAATTVKVATSIGTRKLTSETLTAGTIAFVRFTATNSGAVASLTLNIDGTGAKPIKQQLNTSATSDLSHKAQLIAGNTYMFQYNGTNWVSTFNYNNTYSEITDTNLQSSTGSTAGLITGRRFVSALNALIADTLRLQITDSVSTAVNGTPVLAITGSEVHWANLTVRERRYLKLNDSSSGITTSGAGYTISQTANSDLTVHMTIGNGATSNFSRYITLPSPSALTEGDRIEFVITNLSSRVGTIWFDQGVSDASLYRSSQNYNYTQSERFFSTGEHVIADVITVGTGTTKVWRIVKHSELY